MAPPLKIFLYGFASIISSRQATYNLAQHRFLYLFCRLRGREPLHNAFPFFWPLFILAPYFKRKDAHFTDDNAPIFSRFSYENEPTERLATAPTTPASSKASRAAEYWGDLPFFSQPFGMTQRRVSRDVISMNCGRESAARRYGRASYSTRFTTVTLSS